MQEILITITPKQPEQPEQPRKKKNGIRIARNLVEAGIYTTAGIIILLLLVQTVRMFAPTEDKPTQSARITPKETIVQTSEKKMAVAWAKEPMAPTESRPTESQQKASPHYALTDEQRTLIEQVVSAEAGGEPYEGQVAVAQCILNACERDGITPDEVVVEYQYTGTRTEPTDSVKEAVAAVFDRGEGVTDEPILYFYAPARCASAWHESQTFVIEIANHRFFKEEQQHAE